MHTTAPATTTTRLAPVGLCFLGRKRPGFDQEWGRQVRSWCLEHLQRCSPAPLRQPSVEITDEGTMLAGLLELEQAGCEVVVVVQPTMSHGLIAHALADVWPGTILLWATPERPVPGADRVSSCALVGNQLFASILAREGRPFELAYSESLEDDPANMLGRKLALLVTAASAHRLRVGSIGDTAPGFTNMIPDKAAWRQATGIRATRFSLEAFLESCAAMPEDEVQEDLRQVDSLGLPLREVDRAEMVSNSRVYLALEQLLHQQRLDAIALRCWPEMPEALGAWPYFALYRLTEQGVANAMEGDVEGAVSLALAYRAGAAPGVLMDWIQHREDTLTLWHPGNAPSGLSETTGPGAPHHGRHFNNGKPGVVESFIRGDQPVTLFRFWESGGRLLLSGLEGRTLAVEHPLMGTTGRVQVKDMDVGAWFDDACHQGLAHHLALIPGHWMDDLRRLHRLLTSYRKDR